MSDDYPTLENAERILGTASAICYVAGAVTGIGGPLIGLSNKPQPEMSIWIAGGLLIALILVLMGFIFGLTSERLRLELDNAERLENIVVYTERTSKELEKRLSSIEAHAARTAIATEALASTVTKR
jgi:hypothetical protein